MIIALKNVSIKLTLSQTPWIHYFLHLGDFLDQQWLPKATCFFWKQPSPLMIVSMKIESIIIFPIICVSLLDHHQIRKKKRENARFFSFSGKPIQHWTALRNYNVFGFRHPMQCCAKWYLLLPGGKIISWICFANPQCIANYLFQP